MGLVLPASNLVALLNSFGNLLLGFEHVTIEEIGVLTARFARHLPPLSNRLLCLKSGLHPDPQVAEIGRFLTARGLPNQCQGIRKVKSVVHEMAWVRDTDF